MKITEWFFVILGLIVMCLMVSFFVFLVFVQPVGNPQIIVGTIDKTFIDDGNTYFVVESGGKLLTLSNNDNIWKGKWNSNDFLMFLEVGKTYRFYTTGYRIPLFSLFPNIITYEEAMK